MSEEKEKPMTFIPLPVEHVLGILNAVGGILLSASDYEGHGRFEVNRLIDLIEKEPKNG